MILLKRTLQFIIICSFLGLITLVGLYYYVKPDIPSVQVLKDVQLQTPMQVFSRDGLLINQFGEKRRIPVTIDQIPQPLIDAILASIKNRKQGIFNIGGIDSPSNLELVDIINKKMKKAIKPDFQKTEDVQHDFITDISKAQEKLGFKPKITIEEGISKTITRFEHNKW